MPVNKKPVHVAANRFFIVDAMLPVAFISGAAALLASGAAATLLTTTSAGASIANRLLRAGGLPWRCITFHSTTFLATASHAASAGAGILLTLTAHILPAATFFTSSSLLLALVAPSGPFPSFVPEISVHIRSSVAHRIDRIPCFIFRHIVLHDNICYFPNLGIIAGPVLRLPPASIVSHNK